eukprot:TCONS_00011065-protein
MYQTVRRAGKRYIVSKVNGSTNSTNNHTNDAAVTQNFKQQIKPISLIDGITRNSLFAKRTLTSSATPSNLLENVRSCYFCKQQQPHRISRKFLHTVSNGTLLQPHEIEETLTEQSIKFEKGFTGYLVDSTCCVDSSIFINQRTGESTCRSCGVKQSWEEFLKEKTEGRQSQDGIKGTLETFIRVGGENSLWESSVDVSEINAPESPIYFETFRHFDIRLAPDNTIVYPYYDVSKSKVVKCVSHGNEKRIIEIMNTSHESLFGWNTISPADKTLILTTTELDAMSVFHVTGLPSLSISSTEISLHPDLFPFLEQFNKIVLWFPSTYREQESLQNFSRKLDLKRCWKVQCNDSPFSLLEKQQSSEISDSISTSKHMSHDRILTFKDLRSDLFNELMNAKMNAGVPFTRFPALNEYLKGHRRGELTVFTGATGSGKTTFLSELSLDLCLQGVKTLWGSFEIRNVRLLNTLMHQFAGFAVEKHMDKFMKWSENFESLPLYFMSYYGAQDLQDVINTIEYSVYMHDIEHVIVDNLQFMTSTSYSSSDDRFQVMDRSIAAFRRCASDLNIHITVVVHPRKENDGGSLQTASIYGSAKASQEADNVLILQTSDQLSMQITKNRFCGTVGMLPLSFHPDSLCLSGFHRNVETEEEILPALRIRRPVSNVKIYRKNNNDNK